MKKILMAAAIIGTVAAVTIIYLLGQTKILEDPTEDIWG
jgi:hypothetical protein